ncbi:MAG: hypothetical protein Fur0042_12690 [Cyanophyceae cyanobacterium]
MDLPNGFDFSPLQPGTRHHRVATEHLECTCQSQSDERDYYRYVGTTIFNHDGPIELMTFEHFNQWAHSLLHVPTSCPIESKTKAERERIQLSRYFTRRLKLFETLGHVLAKVQPIDLEIPF